MAGLLSSMLMGPAQRLVGPNAMQAASPAVQGGLLAQFRPEMAQSPWYQAFDRNRDTLVNTMLGGVGAESPLERMRGMAQGAMAGRENARLLEAERAKQREAQQQINYTLQAMQKSGRNDLVQAVQGGLPIAEAWKTFLSKDVVKPTDDMREYEFARSHGFEGSFQDWMVSNRKAGATNINMPGQPTIGTVPQGWAATQDPQTGEWSMAPIKGGPEAQKADDQAASAESKDEQRRTWNLIVNDEIGRALNIIEGGGWLPTTGLGSDLAAGVGGTAARDLKGLLDTVKANAGFDRLQAMRDASPTGGALGQVSERELAFLQSTIGNLEQSQSKEQITYNLKRLQKIYQNMLDGKRAYDGLLSDNGASGGWQDAGDGIKIRRLD
jgi:hypothetical protein